MVATDLWDFQVGETGIRDICTAQRAWRRDIPAAEHIHAVPARGARAREQGYAERLIVVVDQFEELFTLADTAGPGGPGAHARQDEDVNKPEEAATFLAALEALAARPDDPAAAEPGAAAGGMRNQAPADWAKRLPAGVVVLAVRGDFLDRCSACTMLAQALEERAVVLSPMNEHELRRAITGPAAAAELRLQEGLAEQIDADLADHLRTSAVLQRDSPAGAAVAGALPLLSRAVTRTWANREGDRLTHAAYDRGGGVATAVTDTAEEAWRLLDPEQRPIAQRILMAFAVTGIGGQVSRRRVSLTELAELTGPLERRVLAPPHAPGHDHGHDQHASHSGGPARQVLQVVEAFTSARLMVAMGPAGTSDRPPHHLGTGSAQPDSPAAPPRTSPPPARKQASAGGLAGTVELAHDVLLTAWPRLRSWLADDQAARIMHGRIVHEAAEWDQRGRNSSFLYRGSRLEEAHDAAVRRPWSPPGPERPAEAERWSYRLRSGSGSSRS
ncbi:hypothetical protein GCM10022419_124370 [Nonomuraea rosea]|uniref:Novel STAND NTPase 1 domain-containing protein n=1 Tax=Nonomuraea rosea TaxID=638574 RepID=A0ABP6ZSX2_9ACTN